MPAASSCTVSCLSRVVGVAVLGWLLALAGGCASKPAPLLTLGFPPIPFRFVITLSGPAPRIVFNMAMLDPAELSRINRDGFFPEGTARIMVAEDGYLAGLYRPAPSAAAQREPAESPNGAWTVERNHVVQRGIASHVLTLENLATRAKRHHWSTGKFTEMFWSPDSREVALNELPSGGSWTPHVLKVDTGELAQIERRTPGLSPFFTPEQLEAPTSSHVTRWVGPRLLLVRVYGPNRISDRLPEWGCELLVDTSVASPEDNCRVLRAFVREPESAPIMAAGSPTET